MSRIWEVHQIHLNDEIRDLVSKEGFHCHVKALSYKLATLDGKPELGLQNDCYTHVANIGIDDLNGVFAVGNCGPKDRIEKVENEAGVSMRSVSVGDLIKSDAGVTYVVSSIGFKEIVREVASDIESHLNIDLKHRFKVYLHRNDRDCGEVTNRPGGIRTVVHGMFELLGNAMSFAYHHGWRNGHTITVMSSGNEFVIDQVVRNQDRQPAKKNRVKVIYSSAEWDRKACEFVDTVENIKEFIAHSQPQHFEWLCVEQNPQLNIGYPPHSI